MVGTRLLIHYMSLEEEKCPDGCQLHLVPGLRLPPLGKEGILLARSFYGGDDDDSHSSEDLPTRRQHGQTRQGRNETLDLSCVVFYNNSALQVGGTIHTYSRTLSPPLQSSRRMNRRMTSKGEKEGQWSRTPPPPPVSKTEGKKKEKKEKEKKSPRIPPSPPTLGTCPACHCTYILASCGVSSLWRPCQTIAAQPRPQLEALTGGGVLCLITSPPSPPFFTCKPFFVENSGLMIP